MKGRIRYMTAFTSAYAHAYQATCLTRHIPAVPPVKISAYQRSKPDIRTFPMIVPQHVQEAMISEAGPFIQTEVLASWMVKLSLDGV